LISSLGPDEEDAASRRRRRRDAVEPEPVDETGTVDERGVLTSPDEATA
jgi:hypothetical protein